MLSKPRFHTEGGTSQSEQGNPACAIDFPVQVHAIRSGLGPAAPETVNYFARPATGPARVGFVYVQDNFAILPGLPAQELPELEESEGQYMVDGLGPYLAPAADYHVRGREKDGQQDSVIADCQPTGRLVVQLVNQRADLPYVYAPPPAAGVGAGARDIDGPLDCKSSKC